MTKRMILLLLAALFGLGLQAQTEEKDGTYYYDAIPVTLGIGKTTFTDMRDTRQSPPWYNNFIYQPRGSDHYKRTQGHAVFYRMEMPVSGDVIIHNWNSWLGYTTLFVYRLLSEIQPGSDMDIEDVATFEENDFLSPDFNIKELGIPDAFWGLAYLHLKNLPAGTYYIVTAGYKYSNASVPDGKLRINIIADLPPNIPPEPEIKPAKPDTSLVQYHYDLSGNRIKTIKKQD